MALEFHNIEPVYDENSKILILGSFPSVKSRETGFFYGHPQNRFWRVVAAVRNETGAGDDSGEKVVSPEKRYSGLGRHKELRYNRLGRQQHKKRSSERYFSDTENSADRAYIL